MDRIEVSFDRQTDRAFLDVGKVYLLRTRLEAAKELFEVGGMTKQEFVEELKDIRSKLK